MGSSRAMRRYLRLAVGLLMLGGAAVVDAQTPMPAADIVDEPIGARYSLGQTLWHLGHNARLIEDFHTWLKVRGASMDTMIRDLPAPRSTKALLLEPELLPEDQRNGWEVAGGYLAFGNGDRGPTVRIPLSVPKAGCYRLWVRYEGWATGLGLTRLRLYSKGDDTSLVDDEVYDLVAPNDGPQWHDLIVDLEAGDYELCLSAMDTIWQAMKGTSGRRPRRFDCFYLTERLWEAPPSDDRLAALRTQPLAGLQRTVDQPLSEADALAWRQWLIRPVSWEQRAAQPALFALGRAFWREKIDSLAKQEYADNAVPNYREDVRQVVFDETWNLIANPVRARRQIDALSSDVARVPLPYHYVWHDVATNVAGLEGTERPKSYGNWTANQGCLFAWYGDVRGTVSTTVPVRDRGRYAVWVLSSSTNLSYEAPWIGTVSGDGRKQFEYHHQGKIPKVWMKMGEVSLARPGPVQVDFTLDGAGKGGTYRRIYSLFLIDDLQFVPQGTVRPPWTLEMYRERAAQAGARNNDPYLSWVFDEAYTPLSQEVWTDRTTEGQSWPETPVSGAEATKSLALARDSARAVQVGLRNLIQQPLVLSVEPGPLQSGQRSYPGCITWRVVGFAPGGKDRQSWSPFVLLRRPDMTIPPLGVGGIWLTIEPRNVPPGDYTSVVRITAAGAPVHTVTLRVRVSPVAIAPRQPVLIYGFSSPPEGEVYLRDYALHGMNVWRGVLTKAQMAQSGMRLLIINVKNAAGLEQLKSGTSLFSADGPDYRDWVALVMDEPTGDTPEKLKPYVDLAQSLRALDPRIRICLNPGETATLATFKTLAPYGDFWLPYTQHLAAAWQGPEKWAIYKAKPWMWYTTPCYSDKSPVLPRNMAAQIRSVPSQTGQCLGTAFSFLNYPWRDPWDTAYEELPDASTMGALRSRHGPVSTRTWEAVREGAQEANLAMMVRERSGAKVFEDLKDERIRDLVAKGTTEQLLAWLEQHR